MGHIDESLLCGIAVGCFIAFCFVFSVVVSILKRRGSNTRTKQAVANIKTGKASLMRQLDEALDSRNMGTMKGAIKVAQLRIPELRLQNDQEIIGKRDALVMTITEMEQRRPQQHHPRS